MTRVNELWIYSWRQYFTYIIQHHPRNSSGVIDKIASCIYSMESFPYDYINTFVGVWLKISVGVEACAIRHWLFLIKITGNVRWKNLHMSTYSFYQNRLQVLIIVAWYKTSLTVEIYIELIFWIENTNEVKTSVRQLEACVKGVFDNILDELCTVSRSFSLTAHNWQKWKRVLLTCPCHKICRDEAVGLKSCKYTWKITNFFCEIWCNIVKIWYFVNNCLIEREFKNSFAHVWHI